MEVSTDDLVRIIGGKEVDIIMLKTELTRKDAAIQELEKRFVALKASVPSPKAGRVGKEPEECILE